MRIIVLLLSFLFAGVLASAATPTITSVSPGSGSLAGGMTITITGTNLTGTSSVTFGGTAATSVIVISDSTVNCVTPAKAAGTVDVGLTTPGGSTTAPGAYQFQSAFTLMVFTGNPGTSASNQFRLPLVSGYVYNFVVDWGDGHAEVITTSTSPTHNYASEGIYLVKITENVNSGFPAIFFNNDGDRLKLLQITNWGDVTWTTMAHAFYGCSNLTITATDQATAKTGNVTDFSYAWSFCSGLTSFPVLNTSAGTNFSLAWYHCSGLTSFPNLNTSAGTNFNCAWSGCSGLTSFPNLNTSAGTNFSFAWYVCSGLISFPALNTGAGTDFTCAWYGCSGLTSFPALDTSKGTNFFDAWSLCSGLLSFPVLNTSAGTNFSFAWYNCSKLTSFPTLNTSAGTNFSYAWYGCSGLTSFPVLNTGAGTDFSYAWYDCTGLTGFPTLNTSAGTNFSNAWCACSGLTSFPALDTGAGTTFSSAWQECTGLTSFPALDTGAGTTFWGAWYGCTGLTSFPALNTGAGTSFASAWRGCTDLTSFPALDTSAGTNFFSAWYNCTGLTSFPVLNTSVGTNFSYAWDNCTGLTSFPLLNTSAGTDFSCAWYNCTGLTSFPLLNTGLGANFQCAWQDCSGLITFPILNMGHMTNGSLCFSGVTLSILSYSNLLIDLAARNTNASVTFDGGNSKYNSGAVTARNTTLITGLGWTITDGGLCGQRYRVGAGGNWSDTAHWSATSGGASGASVPTANDDVFFDVNSGGGTCALDVAGAVGSIYFSGGVTTLATNALSVAGSVSIGSGATLNCGGMNISVAGNWANAGTFTAGTGTVTLNGAGGSTQVISGSTTFHNLTATCTVARTIQFTAGTTQTVTGALTLTGAPGQLLSLRSTASPGTWSITPTGTLTCSYVDVQDGINTTALVIAPTQSTDSGHNTQWFAPAAPAGSSKKGGCGLGGAFAMVLLLLSWRMALRRW
jgi:hypothetical protein